MGLVDFADSKQVIDLLLDVFLPKDVDSSVIHILRVLRVTRKKDDFVLGGIHGRLQVLELIIHIV